MSTVSLDFARLKQMAIEKWGKGGLFQPVKVAPLDDVREREGRTGRPQTQVTGYFTIIRAILMKTPSEMEDILGFRSGTLASGVVVFRISPHPSADQFELRGYTQTPEGRNFAGTVLRRSDRPRPQFLDEDGNEVPYPPGLGVEQWRLTELVPGEKIHPPILAGMRFSERR